MVKKRLDINIATEAFGLELVVGGECFRSRWNDDPREDSRGTALCETSDFRGHNPLGVGRGYCKLSGSDLGYGKSLGPYTVQ